MTADSHPRDEGAPEVVVASHCPLCGAVTQPGQSRCPECNMALAGTGGRPGPFSRRAIWLWAAALLAVYLVVLAVVALTSA